MFVFKIYVHGEKRASAYVLKKRQIGVIPNLMKQ
jgi:hypothetical protein